MNFKEHYFTEEAKIFADYVKQQLNELNDEGSEDIDSLSPEFVNRLCNYIEKVFPAYGDFDSAIGNEIRKYMKGDNNQIKKMKKKLHDVINKAKSKFLDTIQNKCEKIKVVPKKPNDQDSQPATGEQQQDAPSEF